MTILTYLVLGLLIGAQHAFEPDHLAAVSTMLPGESSLKRAAARGAWWGLGHGAAIAAVGLPLVILGITVPEALEGAAEFVVAIMLVMLGVRALWRAWHRWEATTRHRSHLALSTTPVGLVHGLAGSGAAVALATAQSPSTSIALAFLVIFTLGSTLGMALTAAFVAWPMKATAKASDTPWMLYASGLLSVGVGVVWGGPHVLAWLG